MPLPLKAVLFDHDGTLVDSETTHYRLWAAVLQDYGIAFPEALYQRHHAGVPTVATAVDLVQRYALDVAATVLAEAKHAATRAFLERQAFPLMPGARAAIAAFRHRGLALAVVTGASGYGIAATLRAHALHDAFATVVSADDVRHNKPAPDGYRLAMRRLGIGPDACVAIEDTEHGVAAAHAAGIACIALPTPLSVHHDFGHATAVLRDLDAAAAWIAARCAPQP